MANYFEKVKRLENNYFNLPVRKTKNSAGYDFEVAENIIIPSYQKIINQLPPIPNITLSLKSLEDITRGSKIKPTLVPTGVKCHLDPGYYLELSVRSSTPLKHWLIMANGIGTIDQDYWNNETNEGEIFFQLINLSPYDIQLTQGDIIGQGIIKKYYTTEDDIAEGKRTGGFGSTSEEPEREFLFDACRY